MSDAVFTYQQFQRLLTDFTRVLPALLARSPDTTDLARQVDALLDVSDSPFTVAVMGQMRSGKSTLLNALIGRDLAVTGVTETTATINWFKYAADAAESGRFRVAWKDAPEETLPFERIREWVGDSANARRTRYLEFFAPSEFLKTANIVDTPGTRSVIEDHTTAVADFLHRESMRQGGRADAIVYVLMPVGRENDERWLQEFEQVSRLPGASPYNSLAVVHKWEVMLDVDDPAIAAERKAQAIYGKLAGKVSCVIPVSAPLAICHDRLAHDAAFWDGLLRLGRGSSAEAIGLITLQEDYYLAEADGCALSVPEREALRGRARAVYPGLPWPSFRAMVRTARQPGMDTPEALCERIGALSGFARLRRELRDRYFARARMIKAFSTLAKAWKPCQVAQMRLRNLKSQLDQTLRDGVAAEALLSARLPRDAALQPAIDYIRQSRAALEERFRTAQTMLSEIAAAVGPVQSAYEDMERELAALERLDALRESLGPDMYTALHFLLGGAGPEIEKRLGATQVPAPTLNDVLGLCERLRLSRGRAPTAAAALYDIAITRAEQLADWLEAGGTTVRSPTDA